MAPWGPTHLGIRSAAFSRASTEAHSSRVCSRGPKMLPSTNACSYAGLKLEEILDGNAADQQSRHYYSPPSVILRVEIIGRVVRFFARETGASAQVVVISSRVAW